MTSIAKVVGIPHPPAVLLMVLTMAAPAWPAGPTFFDGHGIDPTRGSVSEFPFEHVDPLTGNLLLTFTDLALPGDGGFDLKIRRTYNSKVYRDITLGLEGEESWAGFGWILHMGRMINPDSTNPGPVVEMPDGSRHPLYLHPDGNTSHFQTREFWTYDRASVPRKLRLPSGVVYTFAGNAIPIVDADPSPDDTALYATGIEDPFGNRLDISYNPSAPETIDTITQTMMGGDVREVRFRCGTPPDVCTNDNRNLSQMELLTGGPSITWGYTQVDAGLISIGYTLLTAVQPPEGPSWQFEYYDQPTDPVRWAINSVTTPNGGVLTYVHARLTFYQGSMASVSPAVTSRTVGGRLPSGGGGTWTYDYDSSTAQNETTVTSPCGRRTVHRFLGISPDQPFAWKLGALEWRETRDSSNNAWERETFAWIPSDRISAHSVPQGGVEYTRAPLLQSREVSRPGQGTYTTTYTYDSQTWNDGGSNSAAQFNDYGRPYETVESGDLSRTTNRTFFYFPASTYSGFSTYIVDKTDTETVTSGGESYSNDYGYLTTPYEGFLQSQTVRGITTTFAPDLGGGGRTGNVHTATDGNGKQTLFTYDWGVQKNVTTPEYEIGRAINPEGTIQSESRNGFTTTFEYDDLFRPRKRIPPNVNPPSNLTEITYDNLNGTWVKTSRGSSFAKTNIDGFGRLADTVNSMNVKTQVLYDGCGRVSYQSYPFEGATNKGDALQYDPLDRVIRRTHPDNEYVHFDYAGPPTLRNGIDFDTYDEENRHGSQDWSAFGEPGDARLITVRAAIGTGDENAATYTYNGLGSLKSVTQDGVTQLARTWTYYAGESGGKPGLLKTETNPENGTVSYTYDQVGNVRTRTDAKYGPSFTRFRYDGNNRLIRVSFPTTSTDPQCSAYDKLFVYDDADNKTQEQAPASVDTQTRPLMDA